MRGDVTQIVETCAVPGTLEQALQSVSPNMQESLGNRTERLPVGGKILPPAGTLPAMPARAKRQKPAISLDIFIMARRLLRCRQD